MPMNKEMSNEMNKAPNNTIFFLSLLLLALLVSGTKACQEDYDLGSRTSTTPTSESTPTPTPSPTPTPTPTPEETVTPTDTPTTTPTTTPSATPTPTPTPDDEDEEEAQGQGQANALQKSLAAISGGKKNQKIGNWGDQWKKKDPALNGEEIDLIPGTVSDPDNDGYTDWLENLFGTDPSDYGSFPKNITTTALAQRLVGLDDDGDGLSNELEKQLGTHENNGDSDGDGSRDNAEKLSGTDPLDKESRPNDLDGDGLSDSFENAQGTNPTNPDTDDDGLRDDLELALGTNSFDPDTDKDGILDGKEVELGSDPLKPEQSR